MKKLISKSQFGALTVVLAFAVASFCCSASRREHWIDATEKADTLVQPEHVHLAGLVIFPDTRQAISKYLGRDAPPLWTPSTNIVVDALNQLPNYLLSTNKGPLAHPLYAEKCLPAKENLPTSICQVVGITFEGRKGVLLNFLPSDRSVFTENWQQRFIKVYDGGARWWSVVYLPDEKTFTGLRLDLGY